MSRKREFAFVNEEMKNGANEEEISSTDIAVVEDEESLEAETGNDYYNFDLASLEEEEVAQQPSTNKRRRCGAKKHKSGTVRFKPSLDIDHDCSWNKNSEDGFLTKEEIEEIRSQIWYTRKDYDAFVEERLNTIRIWKSASSTANAVPTPKCSNDATGATKKNDKKPSVKGANSEMIDVESGIDLKFLLSRYYCVRGYELHLSTQAALQRHKRRIIHRRAVLEEQDKHDQQQLSSPKQRKSGPPPVVDPVKIRERVMHLSALAEQHAHQQGLDDAHNAWGKGGGFEVLLHSESPSTVVSAGPAPVSPLLEGDDEKSSEEPTPTSVGSSTSKDEETKAEDCGGSPDEFDSDLFIPTNLKDPDLQDSESPRDVAHWPRYSDMEETQQEIPCCRIGTSTPRMPIPIPMRFPRSVRAPAMPHLQMRSMPHMTMAAMGPQVFYPPPPVPQFMPALHAPWPSPTPQRRFPLQPQYHGHIF